MNVLSKLDRPRLAVTTIRTLNGFTLVEVLVALLVMAIGLLGLAALQTQGLRYSTDSYTRSQSTTLAYDIIEQMRVQMRSEIGADENPYLRTATELAALGTGCDHNVGGDPVNDLRCWMNEVRAALPGAIPSIVENTDDDAYVDITLAWLDREPRDFDGELRLPETQEECEASANRSWTGPSCFVTQTFTVFP